MELAAKNILVVGLARTGVALTKFLAGAGARVWVTDAAPAAALEAACREIQDLEVPLQLGVAEPQGWQDCDLILPSPGVPPELPWLLAARERGIPVWGELELAARFLTLPVLAVSGTNGKTTTITLVGEFLQASGLRALVGGNIGTPLVELLPRQGEADFLVLEVSSFQLDTAPSFHPQAAALLNITQDHLDRYPDMAAYVRSKAGLFRGQGPEDLKILNADDPRIMALDLKEGRLEYFSTTQTLLQGAWLADGAIQLSLPRGLEAEFPLKGIRLAGRHNLENIMAALLLALDAGAAPEACREVLARFPGLPHRVEWVANIGGVDFYDDSKGTNVGAVARAVSHFEAPVVLIAGGRDKMSDFTELNPIIARQVKALVLLGEAQDSLARAWKGLAPITLADDLQDAVARARELARPGEVVLLSPACASFDMFRDYVERGLTFQRLVKEMENAAHSA